MQLRRLWKWLASAVVDLRSIDWIPMKSIFFDRFSAFAGLAILAVIASSSEAQVLNTSSHEELEASLLSATEKMTEIEITHFQNGVIHVAFDSTGFMELPDHLRYMMFGVAFDQLPEVLAGFSVEDLVKIGESAEQIQYILPPGKPLRTIDDFAELEDIRPDLALELAKRATSIDFERQCREGSLEMAKLHFLPEEVGSVPAVLSSLLRGSPLLRYGLIKDVDLGVAQADTELWLPMLTFDSHINDFGRRAFDVELSTSVLLEHDVFQNASSAAVRSNLPDQTCQKRYIDHNDYFQTVSPNEITISNTVTMEQWACGRIDFGVGSKGFKTRLFRTTSSQDISIMPIASSEPLQMGLRIDARDERYGTILSRDINFTPEFVGRFSLAAQNQNHDEVVLGEINAILREGERSVLGGPSVPLLELEFNAKDARLRSELETCATIQELVRTENVVSRNLELLLQIAFQPREN